MALQPVVQIIHISDLHIKDIRCDDAVKFHSQQRVAARLLRRLLKKYNLLGWEEGTSGHRPHAPESFRRFLYEWREQDPRWFGDPANEGTPQTWLLDTGDLTTFGDDFSLGLGKSWMAKWREILGSVRSRELYGNHDAWPSYHPGLGLLADLNEDLINHRTKILSQDGWDNIQWLKKPLTVNIPGTESRIELYAMDTVCWEGLASVLAVGRLDKTTLTAFRKHILTLWKRDRVPHFRILATHHPIAFPYLAEEKRAVWFLPYPPVMRLLNADRCIRFMSNEGKVPQIGPLVHLFLSGHTHAGYPAGPLPEVVTEIYQQQLHPYQLQLVVGPLMLIKDRKSATQALGLKDSIQLRKVKGYGEVLLECSNCQLQILQFYADPDAPGELTLIRIPVTTSSGHSYHRAEPNRPIKMYFSAPAPT